jgi:uncharacterized protein (TIGR01777 family)
MSRTLGIGRRCYRESVGVAVRETGCVRIAVTGSHGMIGSALVDALAGAGHRPIRVVRSTPTGPDEIAWDPVAGTIDARSLEGVDAVVHLAGRHIGRPWWTEGYMASVKDTRVRPTYLLAETLAKLDRKPSVLVSASGIHYYGDRGEEILTEESPPGEGFLAGVAMEWELATSPASGAGIRVVIIRNGVVVSPGGGALAPMMIPMRLGLGGKLGPGSQYWSWIALDDHLAAVQHILATEELSGPVNVVSPEPVRNADFVATIGRVLRRPTVLPVPAFALKLVLGPQMANQMALYSQRVVPRKLEASGFKFAYPDLEGAFRHVLGRPA